jgi:hypothetical protein
MPSECKEPSKDPTTLKGLLLALGFTVLFLVVFGWMATRWIVLLRLTDR